MVEDRYRDLKLGERGALLSIAAYIVLSFLKLFIGALSGSEALRADGLNNATDIVASIALFIGLRLSQKPPDEDHPYGHWKAETVASMVASFIMIAVGLQVVYGALISVFAAKQQVPDVISIWTGIGCSIIMYGVYRYNRQLGEKINSQAVIAAAKDNLSDVWVSVGTVIGIIGSQFAFAWIDSVTAVIVGVLIVKTGIGIFKDASLDLTDGYDEHLLKVYEQSILNIEGVKGIKNLRARKYGNNHVVDVVILVQSTLDIEAAHHISDVVEHTLYDNYDIFEVHVHVEPQ